ncbi:MAG: hypothetical protein J7M39_00675 [Anaerolineae bacterium]|nr:hypothetical protein [Anaerolineae bacterium]
MTRAAILLATVAATVYITIIVANFGGYIDESIRANIDFGIGMSMRGMQDVTTEERDTIPLTNKQVSWLNKLIITLSPLSSAPAWVYGVVWISSRSERGRGPVLGGF